MFEPELIQKGQTRIDGMDDKIHGLYAAGLAIRDIRAHSSRGLWNARFLPIWSAVSAMRFWM